MLTTNRHHPHLGVALNGPAGCRPAGPPLQFVDHGHHPLWGRSGGISAQQKTGRVKGVQRVALHLTRPVFLLYRSKPAAAPKGGEPQQTERPAEEPRRSGSNRGGCQTAAPSAPRGQTPPGSRRHPRRRPRGARAPRPPIAGGECATSAQGLALRSVAIFGRNQF